MACEVIVPAVEPDVAQVAIDQYNGDLRRDTRQYHGCGHAVFKQGHVYEGAWENGLMHGPGKLQFSDGICCEGHFHHNTLTGTGLYTWSGVHYEGDVLHGKRHGEGRMWFDDSPVVYEGQWCEGKRHGQGTIYFDAERKSYYKGDWRDDMKHGGGVMVYASGNMYTGKWEEDQKCGKGTMHWYSSQQRYSGEWRDGQPNGAGEHVWLSVAKDKPGTNHGAVLMYNRYQGIFKGGKRHGEGVLHYASGARYEGEWENDKKHGEGVFLFEDGTVFQGTFDADRPVAGSSTGNSSVFGPRGAQIKVNIEDLAAEEENPEKAAKGVANVLMCHNSELRSLYDKYSKRVPRHAGIPERPSFSLLTSQFWELATDARIICTTLPLAEINRCLMQARAPPAQVQERRTQVLQTAHASGVLQDTTPLHHPHNELLYRDFCEALVRIAYLRYQQHPSLDRRVQYLINNHILPLAPRKSQAPRPGSVAARSPCAALVALDDPAVASLLEEKDQELRRLFLEVAGADVCTTEHIGNEVYDYEATPRACLRALCKAGIVADGEPDRLPLAVAAEVFVEALQLYAEGLVQRVRTDGMVTDLNETSATSQSVPSTPSMSVLMNEESSLQKLRSQISMDGRASVIGEVDRVSSSENMVMFGLEAEMLYPEMIISLVLCSQRMLPQQESWPVRLKALFDKLFCG